MYWEICKKFIESITFAEYEKIFIYLNHCQKYNTDRYYNNILQQDIKNIKEIIKLLDTPRYNHIFHPS